MNPDRLPIEIKLIWIKLLVLFPLVFYIPFDNFEIYSDSWNKVSSTPETLLWELLLSYISIVEDNGWFSFESSNYLCYWIFWGNSENHVNVIHSDISFYDLDIELLGKFLQNISNIFPDTLKKSWFTIFWNYHNVVRAVPLCVSKLLITLRWRHTWRGG